MDKYTNVAEKQADLVLDIIHEFQIDTEGLKGLDPSRGFKMLVMGKPGSGKTYAIPTLLKTELEVFCLFTEPGYGVISHVPNLKMAYIPPGSLTAPWSDLISTANLINSVSAKSLQDATFPNKSERRQFIEVLETLNSFVDSKTNLRYGDTAKWQTDRVLVMDALTGLNFMSRFLTSGGKPNPTFVEWGTMMSNLQEMINTILRVFRCHFVLNAHIEPEKDELTGSLRYAVSTLGRKLAPVFGDFFDDIVLSYRLGTNFYWSTIADDVDGLKARFLPLEGKLPQDFSLPLSLWKEAGGLIIPSPAPTRGE